MVIPKGVKRMNRRLWAWVLAAAALSGCLRRAAAESAKEAPKEIIYLRVIARDDSPSAQAEKLMVRDAVTVACPISCADPADLLPLARSVVLSLADGKAEIRIWSPGGGAPPAPTLYITLGPGNGRNWWGVLYQDALLWARAEEETEESSPCPEEEGHGEDGVEFVWPILTWLLRLLGL